MRSVQRLSTPDRTVRILRESTIVAKAISRHRLEATLQGRTEEACEMETLHSGISGTVLALSRLRQQYHVA
jgi:hypothetical protein